MLKLKKKIQTPCDTCPRYDRYSISKTLDGKIIRYSCHDKCSKIKEWAKSVVKEMTKKIGVK